MTQIKWFEPQAYKTLSNSHGMEIMINNSGEEVSYRYSNEEPNAEVYTVEIQFDQDGDPYFMEYMGDRHSRVARYLSDFLKIQK
jgi:hypothetical protein